MVLRNVCVLASQLFLSFSFATSVYTHMHALKVHMVETLIEKAGLRSSNLPRKHFRFVKQTNLASAKAKCPNVLDKVFAIGT